MEQLPPPAEPAADDFPSITVLDNEITTLFKWAAYLDSPVRYLVIEAPPEIPLNKGDLTQTALQLRRIYHQVSFNSFYNIVGILIDNNPNASMEQLYKLFIDYLNQPSVKALYSVDLEDLFIKLYSQLRILTLESEEDEDALAIEVNKFSLNHQKSNIHNYSDLKSIVDLSFNIEFPQMMNDDARVLQLIEDTQNQLLQVEPLDYSPYQTLSLSTTAPLTRGGQPLIPADGFEIFYESHVNQQLPFLQYNQSETQNFFKVYSGYELADQPRPETLTPREGVDHIYFSLWLASQGSIREAPANTFGTGEIDLLSSQISMDLNVLTPQTVDDAFGIVSDNLTVVPGPREDNRLTAEFIVYDVEIDEPVFLDLLLNTSPFYRMTYLEESTKPFAIKSKISLYYKFPSNEVIREILGSNFPLVGNLVATLTNDQLLVATTVGNRTYPSRTPIIRLRVTRADNPLLIEQFQANLSYLLSLYKREAPALKALYQQYRPPGVALTREILTGSNIKILRRVRPDIFTSEYSRFAQKGFQPRIIDPSEVPEWQAKTVLHNGQQVPVGVLAFPRETDPDRIYLVCSDLNKAPFIGVKLNIFKENLDKFPYLPICYRVPRDRKDTSADFLLWQQTRVTPQKSRTPAKSSGRELTTLSHKLRPREVGTIKEIPLRIIQSLYNSKADRRFIRYGTYSSPSSLIHSVLEALQLKEYLPLPEAGKESFVTNLRTRWSTEPVGLVKQELYDHTDDEIINLIRDPAGFFNPRLFYRLIEEEFNVNIFVFELTAEGNLELQIPRYKYVHIRPQRLRPTILIYQYRVPSLNYPLCEAIFITSAGGLSERVYNTSMSKIMYDIMGNVLKTVGFNFPEGVVISPYSSDPFAALAEVRVVNQSIDEYGKARAFDLRVADSAPLTVYLKPTQPLRLPSRPIGETENRLESIRSIFELGLSLDNLVSLSWKNETTIRSLHFNLDGLMIEIPITEDLSQELLLENSELMGSLPESESSESLAMTRSDPVRRVRSLQKKHRIISQIVLWIYQLYLRKFHAATVLRGLHQQFVEEYFDVDNTDRGVDSDTVYNFDNLSYRLTEVDLDQALDRLMEEVPTLRGENGRLYIYSTKYADGLSYMLKFYESQNEGLSVRVATMISGMYTEPEDFPAHKNEYVFTRSQDLRVWIETINSRLSTVGHWRLVTTLNEELRGLVNPIFFENADGESYYLVQNVNRGQANRAMTVSYNWLSFFQNSGYDTEPLQGLEMYSHKIYRYNDLGKLELIESRVRQGENNFLEILKFKDDSYAALLRLQ